MFCVLFLRDPFEHQFRLAAALAQYEKIFLDAHVYGISFQCELHLFGIICHLRYSTHDIVRSRSVFPESQNDVQSEITQLLHVFFTQRIGFGIDPEKLPVPGRISLLFG